jgi:serine/threonine protein kinase
VPGYEILGELGRGGMGVVYKARQVGLNRLVALKMIRHAGHAGRDALDRFLQEAKAVARLHHPNIVGISEIGEHDGAPFFSLEFCSGGSLDRKLDGTPLEPARRFRVARHRRPNHRGMPCWWGPRSGTISLASCATFCQPPPRPGGALRKYWRDWS